MLKSAMIYYILPREWQSCIVCNVAMEAKLQQMAALMLPTWH
jgi:hypothetical protein